MLVQRTLALRIALIAAIVLLVAAVGAGWKWHGKGQAEAGWTWGDDGASLIFVE